MFKFIYETLEYKKCCFFISVDKGLKAWGVIKLVLISLLLVVLPIHIGHLVSEYNYTKGQNDLLLKRFIVASCVLVVLIVESFFHFYFTVGVFKKRFEYLKFHNQYSIILTIALVVAIVVSGITFALSEINGAVEDVYCFGIVICILVCLLIQIYLKNVLAFIIKKHESTPVIIPVFARLENSDAEDDYTMRIEI